MIFSRILPTLLATVVTAFAQDSGKNLVPDGGFESSPLDRGWEIKCDAPVDKSSYPTLEIDSATAKSGSASLKITVPPQENNSPTKTYCLWGRFPLKSNIPEGSSLHIKGALKLHKNAPLIKADAYLALSINVTYTDGTQKWEVDPHGKFSPILNDWQTVDFIWKAPKGIKNITVSVVLPFNVPEVWLDDISLQVVEP